MACRLKYFCSLSVATLVSFAGCSSAPAPSRPQTKTADGPLTPGIRELRVEGHGTLGFLLPRGWSYTPHKSVSPLTPLSFRVESLDKSAAMMVNVSWDGIGNKTANPMTSDLERMLRDRASRQYMRHSVEKQTVVKQFEGTEMFGFYAQFTDASWKNSEVPAGSYRVVTDGVFRCGNLWGSFTVYSQDKTGDSFTPAFTMIKSFRRL